MYFCSNHFLESDFATAEEIQLNRVALPYGSDSSSLLVPTPSVLSLYISLL
jgi:hypothetical protein